MTTSLLVVAYLLDVYRRKLLLHSFQIKIRKSLHESHHVVAFPAATAIKHQFIVCTFKGLWQQFSTVGSTFCRHCPLFIGVHIFSNCILFYFSYIFDLHADIIYFAKIITLQTPRCIYSQKLFFLVYRYMLVTKEDVSNKSCLF